MSDGFSPNYTDELSMIAGRLERIADDMDECATLRDRFAMAALQGLLATLSREGAEDQFSEFNDRTLAKNAYEIADAMVAARKPKTEAA